VSRFLFVAPPLSGHVNPATAVSEALADRGHEVAWAGAESFLRPVLGTDITIYPTGLRLYRPLGEGGASVVKSFLEGYVVPLARFVRAAIANAVQAFGPDVLVVDQHALAGAILAQRDGLRWASLLPTSLGQVRSAELPIEIATWLRGPVAKLCADAGLPHQTDDELLSLLFSPYLQIAFTTAELSGPMDDRVVCVGPAFARRRRDPPLERERLDRDRQRILVTVGTLNVDVATDFYRRVCSALAPLADRLQAIVLAPAGVVPDAPGPIVVRPSVDIPGLLPHLDAVVCHAGANTVGETLWHGLPLVVAPITLDQPRTAAHVVRAGAGVEVSFASATVEELRAAVLTVLDDPTYRAGAARVRESFVAAGGAAAAAGHLEHLATSR
jgi:MGT family glycosyltransferase